jgi:hypothetical protein
MNEAIFNSKKALPNKLIQEDGTITDMVGNPVIAPVDAYESKSALPNKFLNPDGTYSTLSQIVAEAVDTELFIVVDELPEEGVANKIYLLVQGDKLIEYIWIDNKWDPVGMVEFDIDNYYTKSEVTQLISASLNSAKTYADGKASAAETNAKAYADTLVGNSETTVKSYADGVGTSAVTSANSYTDTAIQTSITQVLGGSY